MKIILTEDEMAKVLLLGLLKMGIIRDTDTHTVKVSSYTPSEFVTITRNEENVDGER